MTDPIEHLRLVHEMRYREIRLTYPVMRAVVIAAIVLPVIFLIL